MGFFNKLFKNKSSEIQTNKTNCNKVLNKKRIDLCEMPSQSEIVTLWLISQKKDARLDTFKLTKKDTECYNIELNSCLSHLIKKQLLSCDEGKLIVSSSGIQELERYNCYVIMHLHPEYHLTIEDFTSNSHWHTINDNDIAWGIFNKRILEYTQNKMWSQLKLNYNNMATLLIEESKYELALDFIFAASFLGTSGMMDDNSVTPHSVEIFNRDITVPLKNICQKLNLQPSDIRTKYTNSQLITSLKKLLPFYYYDIEYACEFMLEALATNNTKGIFNKPSPSIESHIIKPNVNETKKYFYASAENLCKFH